MGRPRIGKRAMTPAERQRRHRSRVEAKKNRTLADERADLVEAMQRLWGGVFAALDRFERAMGDLKRLHAEIDDVSWDEFVRANFHFSAAVADDLAVDRPATTARPLGVVS